jgi:hypothetical protein
LIPFTTNFTIQMADAKALQVRFENVEWLDQMEGGATPEFITIGTEVKASRHKIKTTVNWDGLQSITLWFYRTTTFEDLAIWTVESEKITRSPPGFCCLNLMGPDDEVLLLVKRENLTILPPLKDSKDNTRLVTLGPVGTDLDSVKVRCLIGYRFQVDTKETGFIKPRSCLHVVADGTASSIRLPSSDKGTPFTNFYVHMESSVKDKETLFAVCACEER